ncbi:hypothetical protein [Herbaspirillum frisingense]|uniref:hypothetical protein n=1 Tax=Herbaspirillum frisingense TaxID=92645 RepID=UPI0039AEEDFA
MQFARGGVVITTCRNLQESREDKFLSAVGGPVRRGDGEELPRDDTCMTQPFVRRTGGDFQAVLSFEQTKAIFSRKKHIVVSKMRWVIGFQK